MKTKEVFEREINNLEKEIRRMEQLSLCEDDYYHILQVERIAKIQELQYCLENNL